MGTFTKLTYHVVFGTKYRRPTIRHVFRLRLYDYLGGIVRGLNGVLIEAGGVEDHLHFLANIPPTVALSDAIRDVKAGTSKWVN
jgi:REP element-mobilizing transposase RayT